ncbi:MAG: AAA family ATPase [bacterium]|nr:AAA family ATPase [bacterium]
MKKIAGYSLLEKVGETKRSIVYRCSEDTTNSRVIVKILKAKYPTLTEIARFKQEYEIIKTIDLPGVIKTYDIIEYEKGFALILEDFEGVSLKEVLAGKKNDIGFFLSAAVQLAKTLGALHKLEIVHKDIKPRNILINISSGIIKITDFGISSIMTHENEEIYNPEVINGTLPYMSPEQTGRMNRAVDYRTDLYSLGAAFYEMLTGTVPFKSRDPLEIIHSHIAVNPAAPHEQNPAVPGIISIIVMKLLAKIPEERYQNAFGLLADLKECREQFTQKGEIENFVPGRNDISNRFIMPGKLFGREKEIAVLLRAVEKQGRAKLLLVGGRPGIGKSVLVNEIRKPITAKRGYFISGKYEQFNRDVPYSAIIRAFQGLVSQILSESEEKILAWKEILLSTLGSNGGVVTNIIPDVELIIGKQPEPVSLASMESRNRFNLVFEKFASLFAREEHPLVLFLDDLQWADYPSLELLNILLRSSTIRFFLVICAYRDNDVSAIDPLMRMAQEIEKDEIPVEKLVLSPLAEQNTQDLVSSCLRCPVEKAAPLANEVYQKTGGNPFFINQFLYTLYTEKLLVLDTQEWQWDLSRIQYMQVTDNVVELLAGKINKLSKTTREALKICAAIANRFDLETLALVQSVSIDEALRNIMEALHEGLIDGSGNKYIFHHDRIQEAAYSLIPPKERPELHYGVGKTMLDVDQLNLGIELVTAPEERETQARLNLEAGKKAKASAAYSPASRYFTTGISLLEEDSWKRQYELTRALYTEAIETAYLNGEYGTMDRLAESLLGNALSVPDTVPVYITKIKACSAREDFSNAILHGLDILKRLGIAIPENPSRFRLAREFLSLCFITFGKKESDFFNLPVMTNADAIAILRIFSSMLAAMFLTNRNILALVSFKTIELALRYGNSPHNSLGYLGFSIVQIVAFDNINAGYSFGSLDLQLIEKLNSREHASRSIMGYNVSIRHWKEHIRETIKPLLEAYHIGLETGDLESAASSLLFHDGFNFYCNKSLSELDQDMRKHSAIIKRMNQRHIYQVHSLHCRFITNLMEPGGKFDEHDIESEWIKVDFKGGLASMHSYQGAFCYLLHDYPRALYHFELLRSYREEVESLPMIRDLLSNESLTMLALYPDAVRAKKKKYLKQVKKNLKKLKKWASYSPENILHRCYLIEAELANVLDDRVLAEDSYDRAMRLAKKNHYTVEEALSYERAAFYYFSRGKEKVGQLYLEEAYNCYSRWGAGAKLKQLRELFPRLLLLESRDLPSRSGSTTMTSRSEILDISTVVKAARAISGEIVLSRLLVRIMKIAMENAGAEKGVLILEEKGAFFVEAEGNVGGEDIVLLESIPVKKHTGLSPAVVNYASRTRKTLILENASVEGNFTDDPYVVRVKPRSILCVPILNRARVSGILYFENNLVSGAFTPERLEILEVLSAQLAVSIDNARLYANLEEKVFERTAELADAYARLRDLDRAKTLFFANVSHELRTPLSLILSPLESMIQGDFGITVNNDDENLRAMHKNGIQLLKLINNLLDFSKIEAGKMAVKRRQTNLSRLLQDYCAGVQPSARSRGLSFEFHNNAGELLVWVDRDLAEKAIYNLISNALKFTPQGGRISVSVDRGEESFTVSVLDTGIGIAEENLEVIFDRFTQLDSSSTRKYEGTGIGLSLAKEFTELHDGTISVTSKPGVGSTFSIEIPFYTPEGEEKSLLENNPAAATVSKEEIDPYLWESIGNNNGAQQLPQKADTAGKSGTILVVDDNPDMVRFLNTILGKEYITLNAFNGREAFEMLLASGTKPDLVLADVMMPVMDGYELTEAIKSDSRFDGIPVLLLTAKAETSMKVEGLLKGANDYIVKPFNSKELLARIQSQMQLKSLRDRILLANEKLKQTLNDSSILVSDIGHKLYHELWPFAQLIMIGKTIFEELEENGSVQDRESLVFANETLLKCEQGLEKIEGMKDKIKKNFGKRAEKAANKIRYILDEVLLGYEEVFPVNNIILEKVYDFDADKEIIINAEQIEIVLGNLINNSVQALNSGSRDKKIIVGAGSVAGDFIITIEDSGPGIPDEIMENVFGMFYSTKEKEERSRKGLGLGLHLCRWIVEDCHGGRIEVESEEGVFTRFKIVLPEDGGLV